MSWICRKNIAETLYNNLNSPDRREVAGWSLKSSAAGDWERWDERPFPN
jgi:hypothetical protein